MLCTASVEDRVPGWLRDSGHGWVTAEYGMLPRSTGDRTGREAARGKQGGRTLEIQRLIGRSLRAVTNLTQLGALQIRLDCDLLQADGGTRTASITEHVRFNWRAAKSNTGSITELPFKGWVMAVSAGYGEVLVGL